MPGEKFNEKINIPIAIPAWSALVLIAGGIYAGGILSNKMDTVIEATKKNDQSITDIRDKQTGGLAAIRSLETQSQNHETRITTLERNVIESKRGK